MQPLYLLLMVILLYSYWEVLRRLRSGTAPTPTLGWMLGLGFFIIIPLTVVVLNGGYSMPYASFSRYGSIDLSDGRHLRSFLIIWSALLLSCLTVIVFTPSGKRQSAVRELAVNEDTLKRIFLLTIALSLLDYFLVIWLHGGWESFLSTRWYIREEELFERFGDRFVLFARVAQANQLVFTSAAVLLTNLQITRRRINWTYSGLIVCLLILHMVMTGNRIFVAVYLLSFAALCWLNRRKKLLAAFLAIAPAIAVIAVLWTMFRHDLSRIEENYDLYRRGYVEASALDNLMDSFEGKNLMILVSIVEDFGSKYDYLYGASYARLFLTFIPRSLYPDKPPGLAVYVADLYEPGSVTSLSTTALGELYLNFGLLSVLGLPLLTGIVIRFDRRLRRRQQFYSVGSVMSFLVLIWSVRFSFADSAILYIFSALLIWALELRRQPRQRVSFDGGVDRLSSLPYLPPGQPRRTVAQKGFRS